MNKAKVKLEFERCTIPSVRSFLTILRIWAKDLIVTSYTYLPDLEDMDKKVFRLENIPDEETFIEKLDKEESRINGCIWYTEAYSGDSLYAMVAAVSEIPFEKRYAKARVRFAFEDCSIPDVLEFVVLLPDALAEQIISYTYKSSTTADIFYFCSLTFARDEFIEKLQTEQDRVYQLLVADQVDPESHDIDYAFSATFED